VPVRPLTIDDFDEMVGTRLPRDRARTIARSRVAELGRRHEPGDATAVEDIRVSVDAVDGARIAQVRASALRLWEGA
jgi:putative hemolysin